MIWLKVKLAQLISLFFDIIYLRFISLKVIHSIGYDINNILNPFRPLAITAKTDIMINQLLKVSVHHNQRKLKLVCNLCPRLIGGYPKSLKFVHNSTNNTAKSFHTDRRKTLILGDIMFIFTFIC